MTDPRLLGMGQQALQRAEQLIRTLGITNTHLEAIAKGLPTVIVAGPEAAAIIDLRRQATELLTADREHEPPAERLTLGLQLAELVLRTVGGGE
jgi:hypothetical protein